MQNFKRKIFYAAEIKISKIEIWHSIYFYCRLGEVKLPTLILIFAAVNGKNVGSKSVKMEGF